jgi:hypothetical protein
VKGSARVAHEDAPGGVHHHVPVHERLEHAESARILRGSNRLGGARHGFGGRLPKPFESLLEWDWIGTSRASQEQEHEDADHGRYATEPTSVSSCRHRVSLAFLLVNYYPAVAPQRRVPGER